VFGSVLLLQQRKPNAQDKGGTMEPRLRDMAVRLEEYLWKRSSNNLEEYSDMKTLKKRLQDLANVMGKQQHKPTRVRPIIIIMVISTNIFS
jgi:acyl carrier protein phosphodiesterase